MATPTAQSKAAFQKAEMVSGLMRMNLNQMVNQRMQAIIQSTPPSQLQRIAPEVLRQEITNQPSALGNTLSNPNQSRLGSLASRLSPNIDTKKIDQARALFSGQGAKALGNFLNQRIQVDSAPETWTAIQEHAANRAARKFPQETTDGATPSQTTPESQETPQIPQQQQTPNTPTTPPGPQAGGPAPQTPTPPNPPPNIRPVSYDALQARNPEQTGTSTETPQRPNPLTQTPELQSSLFPKQGRSTAQTTPQKESDKDSSKDTKGSKGDFDTAAAFKSGLQQRSIKGAKQALEDQVREKARAEVKRIAKAGVRRGVMYIVNSIAGSIDASTAGVSTVVNWIMYIFTFGWLNVEMIYGSYIAQGKSKIISPLTIDPLPVPIGKKSANLLLHIAIIAADLVIIIVGVLLLGFAALFLWTIGQLLTSPLDVISGGLLGDGTGNPLYELIREMIL